jgi:hypothetical protein
MGALAGRAEREPREPMIILAHCVLSGVFVVVFLAGQSAGSAAPVETQASIIMQSEAFSRSYAAKYARLQGLSAAVILVDLAESLEDVLVSGSHVSTVPPDYRIHQLERRLFAKLKDDVCVANAGSAVTESLLKPAALRSVVKLADDEQWELTHAQFGTLTGTLVRLLQTETRRSFCASQSFFQLAR